MPVPYLTCMALVASIYHLPPRVLPSVQGVEGGWVGSTHRNTNNTEDLGVMQVNTTWLSPLAHYTHTPVATVYTRLRDDACYNIAAAGAIMRTYLDETGGNLMQAVGNYHSHTATLNVAYQALVIRSAKRLFLPNGVSSSIQRSPAERIALQKRLVRIAKRERG
ncbi:lytic transglycosylase domain-containing protein [Lichenicola cladoniae]|uniref:Lytic transglycosylase domain-containing protein n=2 Tax=Lichenicola cladoniae TaxID=1484109 RepID=A0A6M8HUW3_9PROT|nr:lytic transglycosylase domain-containing protein [Acetobacteraceae bacterium]QKE92100.1 lytic transglycosylase domain-containing protein [Lichenicola cladoniae]